MTGFFTGGGASLSFGNPQDPNAFPQFGNRWRGGMIVEEGKVMPQTDIQTKQPIMRNGKQAEQLALPLLCDGSGPAAQAGMRTDERNPYEHADLGRRVLYIKGSLRFAVGDALRSAGVTDLEIGGYLFVMWTGMGKTGNSDFIGRLWQVHYIRPSGGFLAQGQPGAMPMVNGAPQHTGFQPTQTPVTAPPPQAPNPYAQPQQAAPLADWSPQPGPSAPPVPGRQDWGGPTAQQWPAGQHGGAQVQAPPPPAPAQPQQWGPPQAETPPPASNPWGQAPSTPQGPPAPYGPPQGEGAPPAAPNPWQQ